jgi:glucan phosphoethanolaminetransferase (alkaline phosphatase superfamily)
MNVSRKSWKYAISKSVFPDLEKTAVTKYQSRLLFAGALLIMTVTIVVYGGMAGLILYVVLLCPWLIRIIIISITIVIAVIIYLVTIYKRLSNKEEPIIYKD